MCPSKFIKLIILIYETNWQSAASPEPFTLPPHAWFPHIEICVPQYQWEKWGSEECNNSLSSAQLISRSLQDRERRHSIQEWTRWPGGTTLPTCHQLQRPKLTLGVLYFPCLSWNPILTPLESFMSYPLTCKQLKIPWNISPAFLSILLFNIPALFLASFPMKVLKQQTEDCEEDKSSKGRQGPSTLFQNLSYGMLLALTCLQFSPLMLTTSTWPVIFHLILGLTKSWPWILLK